MPGEAAHRPQALFRNARQDPALRVCEKKQTGGAQTGPKRWLPSQALVNRCASFPWLTHRPQASRQIKNPHRPTTSSHSGTGLSGRCVSVYRVVLGDDVEYNITTSLQTHAELDKGPTVAALDRTGGLRCLQFQDRAHGGEPAARRVPASARLDGRQAADSSYPRVDGGG